MATAALAVAAVAHAADTTTAPAAQTTPAPTARVAPHAATSASPRASHRAKAPRAATPAPTPAAPGESRLTQGRFGEVAIYRPAGRPTSVALFVSGDGGWSLGVVDMARMLAARGALVIGIDIRRYRSAINASGPACQYLAGEFEYLSHYVQKTLGLDEYFVPVLAGYSSGATLAYAVIAQAPTGTFAGALSLGFCADLDLVQPVCRGTALEYDVDRAPVPEGGEPPGKVRGMFFHAARANATPWIVLHGEADRVCPPDPVGAFVAATGRAELVRLPTVGHGFSVEKNWAPQFLDAYANLTTDSGTRAGGATSRGATGAASGERGTAPAAAEAAVAAARGATTGVRGVAGAPSVDDLPHIEVPSAAAPEPAFADTFAVLLTGDGGWAGLDQDVAAALSARGIPVVALNSLKYFWKKREPEAAARDLDRLIAHYAATWRRGRVLLVGYSFGADVLPFLHTRLPAATRARVRSATLLGLSNAADFEFHVTDWLPGAGGTHATVPEVQRMDVPLLCVYGQGEKDTACPQLRGPRVTLAEIGGGHHFGGDADGIVRRMLDVARPRSP